MANEFLLRNVRPLIYKKKKKINFNKEMGEEYGSHFIL